MILSFCWCLASAFLSCSPSILLLRTLLSLLPYLTTPVFPFLILPFSRAPAVPAVEEAAPVEPRERLRRREKWGSYDDDIEEEIFQGGFEVKGEDGKPYFKHLYDARRTIDEWIADPSLWGMLAGMPLVHPCHAAAVLSALLCASLRLPQDCGPLSLGHDGG